MSTQYPEDEFDVAGRERGPEGVHRAPRSTLAAVLPFVLVLVLVPLLAWGAVSFLSGANEGGDDPVATASATTDDGATPAPTDGATDGGTAEPEPTDPATDEPEPAEETTEPEEETETPDADVDTSVSISVLNGAGITGLAGDAAAELVDAGFGSTVAADYASGSPDTTTLYYRDGSLASTAEAIGEILGITNLVEAPSATQNVQIAIVLRADYA
ncbi:LytR C-terminal domain-containing protein [Georgenia wangjunii]|uniref:LytR C-terminal domain-containing protein n=1 Tax=Georgenia wangjunii TaxID=3117730 RepID=UPI002F26C8FB